MKQGLSARTFSLLIAEAALFSMVVPTHAAESTAANNPRALASNLIGKAVNILTTFRSVLRFPT